MGKIYLSARLHSTSKDIVQALTTNAKWIPTTLKLYELSLTHNKDLLQLFSSVQSLSHARLFAFPWTAAHQASLSITNSWSLLKLMSIELSNHLILCHPFFCLQSFPATGFFSNESLLHIGWPEDWCFHFIISPSNEYSGLISFKMDWLDLLAVQGTLKSSLTPQFKNINSWALSFLYSPTLTSICDYWKNHSLD